MNPSFSVANIATRSNTYFLAAAFLLPALLGWAVARIFLLPRLENLWAHAAHADVSLSNLWSMQGAYTIIHGGSVALAATAIVLLLMEWRFRAYRRMTVGAAVILLNSAVFIAYFMMCVSGILLVPSPR